MTKELWINLPVKDAVKSKLFFSQLGFEINESRSNDFSTCMYVGEKNIVVMLFREDIFGQFCGNKITDTQKNSEVLLSFDLDSREAIDELAVKVEKAGAEIFAKPSDVQGWMYGFGFKDLDGHRWNALYMDFSKMPQ